MCRARADKATVVHVSVAPLVLTLLTESEANVVRASVAESTFPRATRAVLPCPTSPARRADGVCWCAAQGLLLDAVPQLAAAVEPLRAAVGVRQSATS